MPAWSPKQRIHQMARWRSWRCWATTNATRKDTSWWLSRFYPEMCHTLTMYCAQEQSKSTYNANAIFLRSEQVARLTVKHNLSSRFGVFDGTNEELVLAQEVREDDSEDNRRKSTTDETFPGLLRAELDQGSLAEEEAEHVSHYIVANNHHDRNDEPNHSWNVKSKLAEVNFDRHSTHLQRYSEWWDSSAWRQSTTQRASMQTSWTASCNTSSRATTRTRQIQCSTSRTTRIDGRWWESEELRRDWTEPRSSRRGSRRRRSSWKWAESTRRDCGTRAIRGFDTLGSQSRWFLGNISLERRESEMRSWVRVIVMDISSSPLSSMPAGRRQSSCRIQRSLWRWKSHESPSSSICNVNSRSNYSPELS